MKSLTFLLVLLSALACSATQMGGLGHYSFYQATPVPIGVNPASFQLGSTIQGYTQINGVPAGVYHQPRITITVKNHTTHAIVAGGSTMYGPQVPPAQNVNYSSSLIANADSETDDAEIHDQVFCTFSLSDFAFVLGIFFQVEEAFTTAAWDGQIYAPCDVSKCEFEVINWCTEATTPPDFNSNLQVIGDKPTEFPPSGYYFWYTVSACFRFAPGGNGTGNPWSCAHGVAYSKAKVWIPPSACTFNP